MNKVPKQMPSAPAKIDQPSDRPSAGPTKPMGIVKYWKFPRNHSMLCCHVLPCRSVSGIQSIECTSIWDSRPFSASATAGWVRGSVAMIASRSRCFGCLRPGYDHYRFPDSQPLFHGVNLRGSSVSDGDSLDAADTRIGPQLRAARLAARMTMAEVAEKSGLTKGFVSKIERDLANVSVASLMRLCDGLGSSVGTLVLAVRGEILR